MFSVDKKCFIADKCRELRKEMKKEERQISQNNIWLELCTKIILSSQSDKEYVQYVQNKKKLNSRYKNIVYSDLASAD